MGKRTKHFKKKQIHIEDDNISSSTIISNVSRSRLRKMNPRQRKALKKAVSNEIVQKKLEKLGEVYPCSSKDIIDANESDATKFYVSESSDEDSNDLLERQNKIEEVFTIAADVPRIEGHHIVTKSGCSQFTVVEITGHKIVRGRTKFDVTFKGYEDFSWWCDSSDCLNSQGAIREYFKKKGIKDYRKKTFEILKADMIKPRQVKKRMYRNAKYFYKRNQRRQRKQKLVEQAQEFQREQVEENEINQLISVVDEAIQPEQADINEVNQLISVVDEAIQPEQADVNEVNQLLSVVYEDIQPDQAQINEQNQSNSTIFIVPFDQVNSFVNFNKANK